jgi:signal transduction histidine kinase
VSASGSRAEPNDVRRRLVISTIGIVLMAIATLAVPVGVIVYRAAEDEARARLDEQVASIATAIADDLLAGRPPDREALAELSASAEGVRVIGPDGALLLEEVSPTLTQSISATRAGPGGTRIELLQSTDDLEARFRRQVLILIGLVAGALLAAAFLAAVQAHRLAKPLERLAASAQRFGEGDFSVRNVPTTNIGEIDQITKALAASGNRVEKMLSTERHFTADATHQLRTGLTGIAIRFELLARHPDPDVVAEAENGLSQTEQMNATIDELLALARHRTIQERTEFDLVALVDDHVADWSARFTEAKRSIAVVTASQAQVIGTKGLAGQIIDIMIDNALKHGGGTVTLLVEGPSVMAIDQGPGLSDAAVADIFTKPVDPSAAHGRGLPLARRLAEVDGGDLEVVGARPLRIRYRLLRA